MLQKLNYNQVYLFLAAASMVVLGMLSRNMTAAVNLNDPILMSEAFYAARSTLTYVAMFAFLMLLLVSALVYLRKGTPLQFVLSLILYGIIIYLAYFQISNAFYEKLNEPKGQVLAHTVGAICLAAGVIMAAIAYFSARSVLQRKARNAQHFRQMEELNKKESADQ